jgi:hypothetical protein
MDLLRMASHGGGGGPLGGFETGGYAGSGRGPSPV